MQPIVPEQTLTVAVETVKRVHQMWQQAITGGVVNGWGLHELRTLWNEICLMGTTCAKPPSTASHQRIVKILVALGGLPEGQDASSHKTGKHTCVRAHIYTCMHACIYTHAHTYILHEAKRKKLAE